MITTCVMKKGITNNDNTYILNNKSLLKKKKEKRYTDDHNNNNNDHDDKIFERILKNVECNKVNRHLYEQDEQVDKYKYNEHFINYLKNNKKKYNDVLKYMYKKRHNSKHNILLKDNIKNKESMIIKKNSSYNLKFSEDNNINKEYNIDHKRTNVLKDIYIYVNEEYINKITNIYIPQHFYEEKRKQYINMKKKNNKQYLVGTMKKEKYLNQSLCLKKNNKINNINIINNDDNFQNVQIIKQYLIYPQIIHFNYILLNKEFETFIHLHNTNSIHPINIYFFFHSDNIKITYPEETKTTCHNKINDNNICTTYQSTKVTIKQNTQQKICVTLNLKNYNIFNNQKNKKCSFSQSENMDNEEEQKICNHIISKRNIKNKEHHNYLDDTYKDEPYNIYHHKTTPFFEIYIYYEYISIKTQDHYDIDKIKVQANLILLNLFINTNILYFSITNMDIDMFYHNYLVIYNPFNITIQMKLKYNEQVLKMKDHISVTYTNFTKK